MSILLALTTSTGRGGVAVMRAGEVLVERDYEGLSGHAERIAVLTEEVLSQAGVSATELTHLAVDVGPGSFTGIRVAHAFAAGLSMSLGLPCAGVASLDAIAETRGNQPALALLDAQKGEVYVAEFQSPTDPGDFAVVPVGEVHVRLTEALGRGVTIFAPPELVEAGGALAALGAEFGSHFAADRPRASAIARIGSRRTGRLGEMPAPVYVRAPDAKPDPRWTARTQTEPTP